MSAEQLNELRESLAPPKRDLQIELEISDEEVAEVAEKEEVKVEEDPTH